MKTRKALLAAVTKCPCCEQPGLFIDGYVDVRSLLSGTTLEVTCGKSQQKFQISMPGTPEDMVRLAKTLGARND